MIRKVNRVGKNTLTVSIPAKWAKSKGIRQGDEVDIAESENKLVIGTHQQLPRKEVTVNVSKSFLKRIIFALYTKGYDSITLKYEDKEINQAILKASRLLMGFEILESNEHSCRLVKVSANLEEKFDILLNRLFAIGITFTKELSSKIKDSSDMHILMEYEENTNRIALFCKRIIQTNNFGKSAYPSVVLYSLVSYLEQSADSQRQIIETMEMTDNHKIKLNAGIIRLFESCIRLQEINMNIFNRVIKGDKPASLLDLFEEHKNIRKKILNNTGYFRGYSKNAYICSKLTEIAELSHHINEELYC